MEQKILYCNVSEKELYDKYPWLEKANFSEAIITVTRKDGIDRLSWLDGVWYNGVWENGVWKGSHWYNGTWKNGVWEHGEWFSGTWENGIWENGTWLYGTWCNGVWRNGTWDQGLWKNGMWYNGTWHGGEWLNGTERGHRTKYRMSLTTNGEIRIGCEVFSVNKILKILADPKLFIEGYYNGNINLFELQMGYIKNFLKNFSLNSGGVI